MRPLHDAKDILLNTEVGGVLPGLPDGLSRSHAQPPVIALPGIPSEFAETVKRAIEAYPEFLMRHFVGAGYPIILAEKLSDAYVVQAGEPLLPLQAMEMDSFGAVFVAPAGTGDFIPYLAVSNAEKVLQHLKPYLFHELSHAVLQILDDWDNSSEVVQAYEQDCKVQAKYFLNKEVKQNPFTEHEQLIQNYYFPSVEKKCQSRNLSHLSEQNLKEVRADYRSRMNEFHESGPIAYARREAAADTLAHLAGSSLYSSGVFEISSVDFIARSFPALTSLLRSKMAVPASGNRDL